MLLAISALVAFTPSASAQSKAPIGDGPRCDYSVCLWGNADFRNGPKVNKFGSAGLDTIRLEDLGKLENQYFGWKGMQDITSSLVNNTPYRICFYSDNNFRGLQFCVGPYERWASVPYWINDRISSFRA
ncbi:peptidase inhibitor family I36 protein [Lentzea alba]|uniref:peptidase inhibitor family I36 protein n=1 Tax=Lentzea alba TaxID=2714351 RepID=UPI0039BF3CF1